MHRPPPPPLLTETEILRKLNVAQVRAKKLRAAGVLTPDYTAENGWMRLYQPSRLNALAVAVQQFAGSLAAAPQSRPI